MKQKSTKKKYSSEELAEAVIFPVELTELQQQEAAKDLRQARRKVQSEMDASDMLVSSLLQFRFQLEDYLNRQHFDPKMSFRNSLKEYIHLLRKKRKKFADEIHVAETELSQLINNHRQPNENILIRLEIHSNNAIPAITWYKLLEREKEHRIISDKVIRKHEEQFVSNKLAVTIG